MNSLPSIDLSIFERLKKDASFRQKFFIAESSAKIAQQLIGLRKRRALNQTQLAKKLQTGQPAISRVESADYLNWSFATLRKFAEALDARIQVIIQASEDVLPDYEKAPERAIEDVNSGAANLSTDDRQQEPKTPFQPPPGAANAGGYKHPRLAPLPN